MPFHAEEGWEEEEGGYRVRVGVGSWWRRMRIGLRKVDKIDKSESGGKGEGV